MPLNDIGAVAYSSTLVVIAIREIKAYTSELLPVPTTYASPC